MLRIGIDAGGTKTVGNLFKNGKVVDTQTAGMGNVLVDYAMALENILFVVDRLLEKNHLAMSQIQFISIGCAGSSLLNQKVVEDLSRTITVPFALKTDIEMSHVASFQNKDGLLLIAGTGSVALSRWEGTFNQKGGWGHLLGDEGSAYWLAKKIVLTYIDYLETGTCPEGFAKLLPDLKNTLPDRSAILDLAYRQPKSELAKLALLVKNPLGNPYLESLAWETAQALGALIIKAMGGNSGPVSIAFEGGLILKNTFIQEALFTYLTQEGMAYQKVETVSGTHAALYMNGKE